MRHFSEIFLIILLLTALSGSLSAQLLFQGERKYLDLHYEDLSTSSWARATDFGERMKRLARQALPPEAAVLQLGALPNRVQALS